eukprot:7612148-Pyramimonas_sp.AAC.1
MFLKTCPDSRVKRPRIENLRHTRDVAHPGRCPPPTIRVLSRDYRSRICGSFNDSRPNASRGQEHFHATPP